MTARRYFARCTGCLEVSALDAPAFPSELACGVCGSRVESMGRVNADRLVFDHVKCACDDRCTSAKGPNCSCSCNGENHGAGMLAVIHYTTIAGSVPTLAPMTQARADAARARFDALTAARAPFRAELSRLRERKSAGEFLGGGAFDRMLTLEHVLGAVFKAKSHNGRMKILAGMTAQPMECR